MKLCGFDLSSIELAVNKFASKKGDVFYCLVGEDAFFECNVFQPVGLVFLVLLKAYLV